MPSHANWYTQACWACGRVLLAGEGVVLAGEGKRRAVVCADTAPCLARADALHEVRTAFAACRPERGAQHVLGGDAVRISPTEWVVVEVPPEPSLADDRRIWYVVDRRATPRDAQWGDLAVACSLPYDEQLERTARSCVERRKT